LSTVVIRTATAADEDAIWPLARDFATTFRLDRSAFDHSYWSVLDDPDALLLVAEAPQVVGYLLAYRHTTFLANGPVAWVEELMVAPSARRHGAGRALMVAAEHWADAGGAAYLALATRRAAAFYEAIGYTDSAVFYRKLST
jgi:GNAT superfamily N-acetyltransferase